MSKPTVVGAICALAILPTAFSVPVVAEERIIEEIIVTARQRSETLQDVPVTVAAFAEEDLDRYNIRDLQDAARLIPNFHINKGASGSGTNIFLRGVGSSSISAAFDQSVALNIDGVVVNRGRFIYDSYLDMGQLEVLKGPQSLYFGKSATAGVISITSNDPGDEFEASAMAAYETEYKQTYTEFVVSGPVTETLGARFAFGTTRGDEMIKNLSPNAADKWRDEEALNGRLTLVWDVSETFGAKLKVNYSEYESDGSASNFDTWCADGSRQSTTVPPLVFPNTSNDCLINGNTSLGDVNPALRAGLPYGGADGKPFLEQESWLNSLRLDWQMTDTLALTSVTGYVDFDHKELDNYSGSDGGYYDGLHRNEYESLSQELRLASDFEGPLNFMTGLYYQDVDQVFEAYQYAANISLLAGPDLDGNAYDYAKIQDTDSKVFSAFVAGYWDITDTIELTAGVRYTDEEKQADINIPYMHYVLESTGAFLLTGDSINDLKFDDKNTSPEVAVNWRATDMVSFYVSYKEGFKSGGIDTSALPTAALSPLNPDFPNFLIFDSEEAQGYEVGMKSSLLDGSMRLNATAFTYDYSDLQVQQFDSLAIQYSTFNASELRTEGFEFDMLWATPVEGLQVRSAFAWTDAEYTKEFINVAGENLKGEDRERNAKYSGIVGLTWGFPLWNSGWLGDVSYDARYNDGYLLQGTLDSRKMSAYWLIDAAIRVFSADHRYEVALIGKNLGDEIVEYGEQAIPATVPGPSGIQDRGVSTGFGEMYTLQFRVNL